MCVRTSLSAKKAKKKKVVTTEQSVGIFGMRRTGKIGVLRELYDVPPWLEFKIDGADTNDVELVVRTLLDVAKI
jgi:hypothetical protein